MAAAMSRKKARIEKKEAVHIPQDVSLGILKMLPAKSLLRFRCVCKTWYALISDRKLFIKLYQKRPCLLICSGPNSFSTVTFESLLMNRDNPILSTPLSLPWKPRRFLSKFLGSCNGIVCVQYRSPDRKHSGSCRSSLILWNPSTGEFKKLPPTPQIRNWFDENTYAGFGYDESTSDYKFVWMVFKPHRTSRNIVFNVFSLKSNTWRRYEYHHYPSSDIILSSRTRFGQKLTGVMSDGAIHWVIRYSARSYDSFRIIAFDLSSNEPRLLETPNEGGVFDSYVVSLSGRLCLCIHYGYCCRPRIDLCMMKEYGVDSSWSKLISIPRCLGVRTFYPILFSKEEGKIVAMVKHFTRTNGYVWEMMRFRVVKGGLAEPESLSCDEVSRNVFEEDYAFLHTEETFVSLN